MSVCLFPMTDDPAKLERLAGVPAGTAAALTAVESLFPNRHRIWRPGDDGIDEGQAMYDALAEEDDIDVDPRVLALLPPGIKRAHLRSYETFGLFGWGRVQEGTYDELGISDELTPRQRRNIARRMGRPGRPVSSLPAGVDGDYNAGDCTDRVRCVKALVSQAAYSRALAQLCSPTAGALRLRGVDEIVDLAGGLRWG